MGLDRMTGLDIELDSSVFPSFALRELATSIIRNSCDELNRVLKLSDTDSRSLSAHTVCRVCFEQAQKTGKFFNNTRQFQALCSMVGRKLSVSPKIGSWSFLAVQAMVQGLRDRKKFRQSLDVETEEKVLSEDLNVEDDDPDLLSDCSEDLSSVDPRTLTGPTTAPAGSEEKILTLIARARQRLPLWVDGDPLGRHERGAGD